jgi:very-short-patch-repair endonuclease
MLPYSPLTKPLARQLRKNQTPAEQLLWSRIRRQQILGVQFYRQKPIAGYIVDFYCFSAKLVIEVDGSQHYEPDAIEYDTQRTKTLESLGLHVIRFSNAQVMQELENVLAVIVAEVEKSTPFVKGVAAGGGI